MPLKALKCPVCGAELQVQPDAATCVCSYCDSTITIPKNLERRETLYNRAVFLRQSDEFDKAAAAYEELLREDNEDADAHWGLLLSKYGIEYVKDPRSGAQVPTFNRTMAQSILADMDYKAALEYAPMDARAVYEAEGKRLNDIQSHILQISRQEPPYEIFICYKETDSAGARTKDSVIAQELYGELEKKGYKVFFARKTLEGKLGGEYEPIIYAALSSAPVMVVVGTTPQNFEAPWVRNEWGRFMRMGKAGEKTIIPAYRDMTAYELPAELSNFQAQDMSKLGFMQDLVDGVEKILRHGHAGEVSKAAAAPQASAGIAGVLPLERLLKNAETYVQLQDYDRANAVYDDVIKNYPEDYRGWWGKIVCATEGPLSSSISDAATANIAKWFTYTSKLAPKSEAAKITNDYLDKMLKRAEALIRQKNYRSAGQIINSLAQNDSQDYRVKWGTVICITEDFTNVVSSNDLPRIEQAINDICQSSAPNDFKAQATGRYRSYLDLVSQSEAAKDKQKVQNMITGYEGQIKDLRLPEIELEQREVNCNQKKKSLEKSLREARNRLEEIERQEKDYVFQKTWRPFIKICGILILPFGLLMIVTFFVTVCNIKFPDMIAGYIFGPCWCATALFCLVKKKNYNVQQPPVPSNSVRREIEVMEGDLSDVEAKYNKRKSELTELMKSQNTPKIAALNEKIGICKQYLALDDEKVKTIFLAKRLENTNEAFLPDAEAVRLRTAVFGAADQTVEEPTEAQEEPNGQAAIMHIEATVEPTVCPVCHQPKKVARTHDGQEVCVFCGYIFK